MRGRAGAPESFLDRRPFVVFLVLVGTFLVLATLSVRSPERITPLERASLSVTGPLARMGAGVSRVGGDAWSGLTASWHAHAALEGLRVESRDLRLQLSDRSELATENDRLRRLLSLAERVPPKFVAAFVIHREVAPDCTLLIDRGTADGISEDAPVISPDGVVGKVLTASVHVSRVLCIIDPDAAAAVLVGDGRRQANAIVRDASGSRCRLAYQDEIEAAQPGDVVVTSGLDLVYPKGLLLGTVVEAEVRRDGGQELVVRPAVDFARLEEVLVLAVPAGRKTP